MSAFTQFLQHIRKAPPAVPQQDPLSLAFGSMDPSLLAGLIAQSDKTQDPTAPDNLTTPPPGVPMPAPQVPGPMMVPDPVATDPMLSGLGPGKDKGLDVNPQDLAPPALALAPPTGSPLGAPPSGPPGTPGGGRLAQFLGRALHFDDTGMTGNQRLQVIAAGLQDLGDIGITGKAGSRVSALMEGDAAHGVPGLGNIRNAAQDRADRALAANSDPSVSPLLRYMFEHGVKPDDPLYKALASRVEAYTLAQGGKRGGLGPTGTGTDYAPVIAHYENETSVTGADGKTTYDVGPRPDPFLVVGPGSAVVPRATLEGASPPVQGGNAPKGGSPGASGSLDPGQFFKDFLLPHEGSAYVAHDANGAPVKYGVNQAANPDVDVANLTQAQATDLFTKRYFNVAGANKLDPAMAAVVADTAYMSGPPKARQLLAASGGDPQKFMDLREQFLQGLIKSNPAKYGPYAHAWATRDADLRKYAQGQAGAPTGDATDAAASGAPPGSVFYNPKPEDLAGDVQLSPDSVQMQAAIYLKTGALPSLGMGKQAHADRARILDAATEIARGLGLSADDMVAGTVSTKAAGAALAVQTKTRSAIEANENTVVANADFAMSLAPKGTGHTVPVINRFEQFLRGEYGGDPDVVAFKNALGTVADEYAKVMTTTTGAGGQALSDAARKEAYARLSAAQTPEQLQAAIAAMKVEMANRVQSFRDVEEGLRNQVRGTNSAQPKGEPPATPGDSEHAPPAAPTATAKPAAPANPQLAASMAFKGSKGRHGTAQNPATPKTKLQYDNLPPGTVYIDTDGHTYTKH